MDSEWQQDPDRTIHHGNGMAVAGFSLAVAAVFLVWLPLVNVVLCVLALIFARLGLRNARQGAPYRGLALAGLIIAMAMTLLILGLVVITVLLSV